MGCLFDTDAISEVLRPKPLRSYLQWLETVPREDQFTSAIVMAELYRGALRSSAGARHMRNIERRILPAVTVLPFDVATARVFGRIAAGLEDRGTMLADADLQIAATALHHDLEVITGNLRHFSRVPDLRINRILIEARA